MSGVSSASIWVGGGFRGGAQFNAEVVKVSEGVNVFADSQLDAGEIVFWADENMYFDGYISAQSFSQVSGYEGGLAKYRVGSICL